MICPNCGWDATNMRKTCEYCGPFVAKSEPTISHFGLEKIEPLDDILFSENPFSHEDDLAIKLNEVIEKVNRIMEAMNKKGE